MLTRVHEVLGAPLGGPWQKQNALWALTVIWLLELAQSISNIFLLFLKNKITDLFLVSKSVDPALQPVQSPGFCRHRAAGMAAGQRLAQHWLTGRRAAAQTGAAAQLHPSGATAALRPARGTRLALPSFHWGKPAWLGGGYSCVYLLVPLS